VDRRVPVARALERMIQWTHQSTMSPRGESVRLETGRPVIPHLLFLCVCLVSLVVFRAPLVVLTHLAFDDDRYTSTLVIPLISVALVWFERKSIYAGVRYRPGIGLALSLAGLALLGVSALPPHFPADYSLSVRILALVLVWIGAFVCCYGMQAARAAVFPLEFLLLMIPLPASVLDHAVAALQRGSAEVTYRLFKLIRVPVSRLGIFDFSLPGVTIEVAEECSGIRSSLSMFLGSIVIGYLLLRSAWSRAWLALLTIPIVIFKNAVRIVTLSWLGVYVDAGFLHGRLHRYGGLPFSLFALALLVPVLLFLMRAEGRDETQVRRESSNTMGGPT
jgi:exosortase